MVRTPANLNMNLPEVEDFELEMQIGVFLQPDIDKCHIYRKELYEDLMDRTYKLTDKRARKVKLPVVLLMVAVAYAAIEVGMTYVIGVSRRNPAAGELLKRKIKAKVRDW